MVIEPLLEEQHLKVQLSPIDVILTTYCLEVELGHVSELDSGQVADSDVAVSLLI